MFPSGEGFATLRAVPRSAPLDAVVVGSGPNGLAAAIELARQGCSVEVLEAHETVGGGMRSSERTLPGFVHDHCSACHPMGVLSPYFRQLPLEQHGLRWLHPEISVAHPLPDAPSVLLSRSLGETAAGLGEDADAYIRLLRPLLKTPHRLLEDLLGPLRIPKDPLAMLRFGLKALPSASHLARSTFRGPRARALVAGCAAHATLPLDEPLTSAMALVFLLTGHLTDWPVVAGGSQALADALASYLKSLGGEIRLGHSVKSLADLPESRAVIFDTSPRTLLEVASSALPSTYRARVRRFRYGPGVFKMDFALDGPIPWTDPDTARASTVHLGGPLEQVEASERAMWRGEVSRAPFVMIVQASGLDTSRAPEGKHTGYAYIHVPHGSEEDYSVLVERRIEAFAPGFQGRILARAHVTAAEHERYNPNWVGGAISGGVTDALQLFFRPVARLDPYRTPNPRLYLCSASTPPGGGVHGMSGYFAARSVLRRLRGISSP